jgi:hypothetical protein
LFAGAQSTPLWRRFWLEPVVEEKLFVRTDILLGPNGDSVFGTNPNHLRVAIRMGRFMVYEPAFIPHPNCIDNRIFV